jgi:hypothetical protein
MAAQDGGKTGVKSPGQASRESAVDKGTGLRWITQMDKEQTGNKGTGLWELGARDGRKHSTEGQVLRNTPVPTRGQVFRAPTRGQVLGEPSS